MHDADLWFRLAGWFNTPAGRAMERRLRRHPKVGLGVRGNPNVSGEARRALLVIRSKNRTALKRQPYLEQSR